MGRHSVPDDDVPDDDGDGTAASPPAAVDTVGAGGRHAQPDEGVATEPMAAEDAATQAGPPEPVGKGNQSTAADLALLRGHSEVRARVLAAALVPIALYSGALYLAGALGIYFIWIWIPLVTSGVVAGRIMDAAHRRHGTG